MNVQITNDRTQLVINFYRTNAMDCGLRFLSRESTPERIMRKRIVCARVIKKAVIFSSPLLVALVSFILSV